MATHDPMHLSIQTASSLGLNPDEEYTTDPASISPRSDPITSFSPRILPLHLPTRSHATQTTHQFDPSDIWANEHHNRARSVENHIAWLNSYSEPNHQDHKTWTPSTNTRYDSIIQDIHWGTTNPSFSSGPIDIFATNTTPWDEDNSLIFEYARDLQEKNWNAYSAMANSNLNTDSRSGYVNNLTHVELDVEGYDADGCRIRVQRILEVNLKVHHTRTELPQKEETTMEFKRTLVLKRPARYALLALSPRDREPYHAMLAQVAQTEVDKALDERNVYLREVFGRDVDHVGRRVEDLGGHNWSCQLPEVGVRGVDGTVLHLVERRTDAVVEGEVILSHVVSVMQIRCGGRNRLFDLPTEGEEKERRIRKARWSVSSAIDRYVAAESADRVVLDTWVDGTFLPRQ